MHIREIIIENIRSVERFHWKLEDEPLPGWHVLIGDNGSGKSTILQAISLALIGPEQALRLDPDWNEWLRHDTHQGNVFLALDHNADLDYVSQRGPRLKSDLKVEINLKLADAEYARNRVEMDEFLSFPITGGSRKTTRDRAYNYIWGNNKGWFSAAYGPFRRFSGGDSKTQSIIYRDDKAAAHASVFYESVALSNYEEWLRNLDYKSARAGNTPIPEGALLERIKAFVNQENFLPYGTRFKEIVPSDRLSGGNNVVFVDGNGVEVSVEQLGDGFRSLLSMIFALIRQMTLQYDTDQIFDENDSTTIIAPGVVLIDEVDAHLHPQWQRRVGRWLTRHFPNIQFIVTTHSPLVCQAAVNGSIWRLPSPGMSLEYTSPPQGYKVDRDSEQWKRLVYGNILEAYSTDLFGDDINRAPEAQEILEEIAELSAKEMDEPLTSKEEERLETLREQLPTTPYRYLAGRNHD